MARKRSASVSADAREAILGWPNRLARELYELAIQQAEKERRDVELEDVLSAWPIAVERIGKQILKSPPRAKRQRGQTGGKAA